MPATSDVTVKVHADLSEIDEAIRLVEVLRPLPDDVILVHVADRLTMEECDALRRSWLAATNLPNRVVVLDGSIDVRIIRPEDVPDRPTIER